MKDIFKKAAEEVVDAGIAEFGRIISCDNEPRKDWIETIYEASIAIIKSTMIYTCVSAKIDERSKHIRFSTCVVCFGQTIDPKSYDLDLSTIPKDDDEYRELVESVKARLIQDLDRFGD